MLDCAGCALIMKLAPLQEAFRDHETGPITGQAGLCRVYQRFTGLSRRLFIVMPPNLGNAAADSADSLLVFFFLPSLPLLLIIFFFFLTLSFPSYTLPSFPLSHLTLSFSPCLKYTKISPSNTTLPPAQPPPLLNKYRLTSSSHFTRIGRDRICQISPFCQFAF